MSTITIDKKLLKKEIKELHKEVKKRGSADALLIALFLLEKAGEEKEREKILKDAKKKVKDADIESLKELSKLASEDIYAFEKAEGSPGVLFKKIKEGEIDEEFKELFKKLPSQIFKVYLIKEFVPALLDKGEADLALFFLNQVEKSGEPTINYLLGWAYEQKGIVNTAKSFYEKAAKEEFKEAKEKLANLYIKQSEPKKAAKIFKELEEWDKAFSALIEAGDIKECLKIIEHIENQELISKLARILIEKGKLKEAKEVVKQLEDEKAKLYEAYILSQEGKTEEAYRIASEIVKDLKGEEKQIAIRIITDYYRESEKWKEITILLSPLETTKLLSDKDRLLLAEAYIHTGDYPRALRILANLMETELRKDAKRLIKKIKEECEEEQVREVCEQLLAEDSFFKRLKEGLSKSRSSIVQQIENLFTEGKKVDAKTLEELEEILLAADVGVEATQQILSNIKRRMEIGEIKNESSLISALEEEILKILKKAEGKLVITEKPFVIMVVGVNGTGKTTSIAKLAYYLKNKGYSVLLAAGDTFRAAAIEQLETWGKRLGVDVIKQKPQADPSGVVYDAVKAAKARNVDVVIIDTAGRLHTKVNLMEELKKMARVASRELPGAPHETLLVLDAVVGQNAISQAKIFSEAIPITGIILTKLDGTAKGGVIIAIAKLFNIPIKFIGVGEKIDDLQEFDAERFVDALFER